MKCLIENENTSYQSQEEVVNNIIKRYKKTSVIIRINSCEYKNNLSMFNEILENVNQWLADLLKHLILLRMYFVDKNGPKILLIINKDSISTKRLIADIEDKHILGKCLNIKVFNEEQNEVRREDIGIPPLVCPLCKNSSGSCNCGEKNNGEDMILYMRNSYLNYKINFHKYKWND